MRIVVCVIAAAAAASTSACTSIDELPVQPGEGSPGVVGGGSSSTQVVVGRVCLVSDLLNTGSCADTGAGGLTVTLGNRTTTTTANGGFVLAAPTAANPTIAVSGPNVVTSQQAFSTTAATSVVVPVVNADLFGQVLAANGITLTQGSDTILGSVLRRGQPVAGIGVTSTPSPAFGPFFDGTTPNTFTLDATGARGVVMLPGVTAGPANLTFTDLATAGETTVDGIPVINGGITFIDAILP